MLAEIVSLLIMAIAVGMDAFSVALGMGIYKMRLRRIFYIGLTVGLFHLLLPLSGIFTGHLLSTTFGEVTGYIGGGLLIVIGMQMVIQCFGKEKSARGAPVGIGLLIYSFLVSVDSFSAGLSLGMFGVRALGSILCFGIVAAILTWSGLILGRKVHNLLGSYGELAGGCILIVFGINLVLPL